MEFTDKDFRRLAVLFLLLALAILVFVLIRPIVLSILAGLILAYALFPVYKIISKKIKNKTLAASLVCLLVIILIVVPIYFIAPIMIDQIFELFKYSQTLNIQGFIRSVFPSAQEPFIVQMTTTFGSLSSQISSASLNFLVSFLLEIPTLLFHLVIVAFVFFYALRDSDRLANFMDALSPLNKVQEKKLVQQFKGITNSVVYGQILVGLVQGITAGIGFFVFGIPNALLLTVFAVVLSVIPILGPFLVWIPVVIYLFIKGSTTLGIIFLIYNITIVSNIDNLLRLYLVSRKTNLSQVIVLIGMVGGLFIFGIIGLILGPLILAYFITFLNAYKENTLSSLFKTEKEPTEQDDKQT